MCEREREWCRNYKENIDWSAGFARRSAQNGGPAKSAEVWRPLLRAVHEQHAQVSPAAASGASRLLLHIPHPPPFTLLPYSTSQPQPESQPLRSRHGVEKSIAALGFQSGSSTPKPHTQTHTHIRILARHSNWGLQRAEVDSP